MALQVEDQAIECLTNECKQCCKLEDWKEHVPVTGGTCRRKRMCERMFTGEPICVEAPLSECMPQNMGQKGRNKEKKSPSRNTLCEDENMATSIVKKTNKRCIQLIGHKRAVLPNLYPSHSFSKNKTKCFGGFSICIQELFYRQEHGRIHLSGWIPSTK